MIAEQLQAARAAHWRQKQTPLLTLDDAQSWLGQHPLCLYLPRRAQLPAPAPSFVEACLGSTQTTPGTAAIEQAQGVLTRLTASATVVPLNLLGAVSEQPDFLATAEALPFVISLRADADWKHAPQKSSGHKISPLVLELWKLLEEHGSMTASEARETLGRELTEAAVLRALSELWQGLRISPVYGEDGQPARWEMMRVRHRDALTTAAGTGQVTAISLLVSMYLQSVYAATSEEIEIFLSPVTSRSRVREAVRGLSATRQIHSLSMDAQTYYFLENGLPEFVTVTVTEPVAVEAPDAPLPVRPKRREHPLTPPSGAPVSAPARPEVPAARSGWKSPQRAASPGRAPGKPGSKPRDREFAANAPGGERPERASGDKFRPRPQRDDRPYRPAGRPAEGAANATARPAFSSRPAPGRSGPPRSGTARGARPWRPKTTADPSTPLRSGRDDKGRAARPGGFARAGASPRSGGGEGRPAGAGRPPFKPRSGPPGRGLPGPVARADLREQDGLRSSHDQGRLGQDHHVPVARADLREQDGLPSSQDQGRLGRDLPVPAARADLREQDGLRSSHDQGRLGRDLPVPAARADLREQDGLRSSHDQGRLGRDLPVPAARADLREQDGLPSSHDQGRLGRDLPVPAARADLREQDGLRSSHDQGRLGRDLPVPAARADLREQDGLPSSHDQDRRRAARVLVAAGRAAHRAITHLGANRIERNPAHDRQLQSPLGGRH